MLQASPRSEGECVTASIPLTHDCITPADQSPSAGSSINILALAPPAALRQAVIRPTLAYLGVTSAAAENLRLGTLLPMASLPEGKQPPGGIGPFGISHQVHERIWDDYLATNPDQASLIRGLASQRCFLRDPHAELGYNFAYATAIAWLVYRQHLTELDEDLSIADLAQLWQSLYPHRDGVPADFLSSWNRADDHRPAALAFSP